MKKPVMIPFIENIERFLSKIIVHGNGCWTYSGHITKDGYGRIEFSQEKRIIVLAHRLSFELFNGPLDLEKVIDHECMNKKCVNPGHLRQVTQKINCLENNGGFTEENSKKTHCPKGHEYSEENTRWYIKGKRRSRSCRSCERIK